MHITYQRTIMRSSSDQNKARWQKSILPAAYTCIHASSHTQYIARTSLLSVHERPLSAPAPSGLVQEQYENASDDVYDDAGPHRERAVHDEQGATQHRGDHPTSGVIYVRWYFWK